MHFSAIHVELSEESNIRIDVVRGKEAPLNQEICYVTIVIVVSALHIVSESAVDCETFLSITLSEEP